MHGKLVFEAIGKYIHPTRYRQIIETESSQLLTTEECQLVSEDQKHSSRVAKVHYRKRRSRDVALKGNACLKRLRGEAGEKTDTILKEAFDEHSSEEDDDDDLFITQNKLGERTESNQDENVLEKLLTLQPNDHQPQKTCDYTQIRSKVPFTHQEDQYLAQGLKDYGLGEWSKIIRDPRFKFHKIRRTDTLKKRVKSRAFKNKIAQKIL